MSTTLTHENVRARGHLNDRAVDNADIVSLGWNDPDSPFRDTLSAGCGPGSGEAQRLSRGPSALFVDLERPVGNLDQDPALLDHHRIDRQRGLSRWIKGLAG